jgi:hypothetical protein
MMISRTCSGWRLCLHVGPLHVGIRKVRDPQERWDRLWSGGGS